jgi:hypothetical protein
MRGEHIQKRREAGTVHTGIRETDPIARIKTTLRKFSGKQDYTKTSDNTWLLLTRSSTIIHFKIIGYG